MKKPKCKPASTLKSVSGLGLSKRAERYVEKNYFRSEERPSKPIARKFSRKSSAL